MSSSRSLNRWLPILMYHRVVPRIIGPDPFGICVTENAFENQMRWFRDRGFTSLLLSDIVEALDQGFDVPPRSFAITFDDGYEETYEFAWPILRRHEFRATVFLVTDLVDRTNEFDRSLGLGEVAMLSAAHVRSMHAGGIQFGSHTCSHPTDLTRLSDGDLEHELRDSKSYLESLLDAPCSTLSYPHGKSDGRVEAAVQNTGYALACGAVGTRLSRYRLDRVDSAPKTARGLSRVLMSRGLKSRIANGVGALGRVP